MYTYIPEVLDVHNALQEKELIAAVSLHFGNK